MNPPPPPPDLSAPPGEMHKPPEKCDQFFDCNFFRGCIKTPTAPADCKQPPHWGFSDLAVIDVLSSHQGATGGAAGDHMPRTAGVKRQ